MNLELHHIGGSNLAGRCARLVASCLEQGHGHQSYARATTRTIYRRAVENLQRRRTMPKIRHRASLYSPCASHRSNRGLHSKLYMEAINTSGPKQAATNLSYHDKKKTEREREIQIDSKRLFSLCAGHQ
jgi:hypothetical protein